MKTLWPLLLVLSALTIGPVIARGKLPPPAPKRPARPVAGPGIPAAPTQTAVYDTADGTYDLLRDGPSLYASVLPDTEIPAGTSLRIFKVEGDWLYVKASNGKQGWFFGRDNTDRNHFTLDPPPREWMQGVTGFLASSVVGNLGEHPSSEIQGWVKNLSSRTLTDLTGILGVHRIGSLTTEKRVVFKLPSLRQGELREFNFPIESQGPRWTYSFGFDRADGKPLAVVYRNLGLEARKNRLTAQLRAHHFTPPLTVAETANLLPPLMKLDEAGVQSPNYYDGEKVTEAIRGLETLGSPAAVSLLSDLIREYWIPYLPIAIRRDVLCALGRIGSKESIGALDRLQAEADLRRSSPPRLRKDDLGLDFSGIDPALTLLPRAKGANGRAWDAETVMSPAWKGFQWLFVNGLNWTPYLVEVPEAFSLPAQLASGEVRLENLTRDSDRDGLTDAMEARLGTDPARPDTDGDGVNDLKDGCPLTPLSPPSDTDAIRQAAFFARFGLENFRGILAVKKDAPFARQQFRGHPGWLIVSDGYREGWTNLMEMKIRDQTPAAATVDIDEWVDRNNGMGTQAKLEKKRGRWVVVEFRVTGVS